MSIPVLSNTILIHLIKTPSQSDSGALKGTPERYPRAWFRHRMFFHVCIVFDQSRHDTFHN